MICVGIAANLANLPYAFSTLPSSPSSLPSCLTSWIQWAISVASTQFYFRKRRMKIGKKGTLKSLISSALKQLLCPSIAENCNRLFDSFRVFPNSILREEPPRSSAAHPGRTFQQRE